MIVLKPVLWGKLSDKPSRAIKTVDDFPAHDQCFIADVHNYFLFLDSTHLNATSVLVESKMQQHPKNYGLLEGTKK